MYRHQRTPARCAVPLNGALKVSNTAFNVFKANTFKAVYFSGIKAIAIVFNSSTYTISVFYKGNIKHGGTGMFNYVVYALLYYTV